MELSILCECRAKGKINKNLLILYYDVTCTIMNFNFCSAWQNRLCVCIIHRTMYYVYMMLIFHSVQHLFLVHFKGSVKWTPLMLLALRFFFHQNSWAYSSTRHTSAHLNASVWLIPDVSSNNEKQGKTLHQLSEHFQPPLRPKTVMFAHKLKLENAAIPSRHIGWLGEVKTA